MIISTQLGILKDSRASCKTKSKLTNGNVTKYCFWAG